MVGPDGIEPSTSPLSGVRSSHLSYGPRCSQHWWSWSGSNRRPPECKSGALPAELQPLFQARARCYTGAAFEIYRGQLDTGIGDLKPPTTFRFTSQNFKWRSGSVLTHDSEEPSAVYGMERLPPTRPRCTLKRFWLSETPSTVSLRKEVIQPQVLLRLPCYDFTPIMDHTLGRCPPCGSACRLLVQSTFVM
jgi:hypothetical protein